MSIRASHLRPSFQRGATLVVVLILLLIMTVLGLAILRGTSLDERMSANMRDRSLSFQAAEAALREGEMAAANEPAPPATGCIDGVCALPIATATDRWLDTSFTAWKSASVSMGSLSTPSSYIVEYMGLAPTDEARSCEKRIPIEALCLAPRYRITARSQAVGRAQVVLQTNFIVQ